MKFAVLVFPGSNCDRDMYNATIKSGAQADYVDYRETSLEGYDGVLILVVFIWRLFTFRCNGECSTNN